MIKSRVFAALAAFLGLAPMAEAATLSIEPIGGFWSSSKPAVEGIGTEQLNWGQPQFDRRSGYHFEAQGPFTVENDTPFVIGTFTHENFPVRGQILESAQLRVSFRVAGLDAPIFSTFSFRHSETRNRARRCPNGQANWVGLNAGGCADRVTATLNKPQSRRFEIDGERYVLDVLGFQYGGGTLEAFWTEENRENQAELIARFTTEQAQGVPQTPGAGPSLPSVPAPASGLLLVTFLLAGGWKCRSSRATRSMFNFG